MLLDLRTLRHYTLHAKDGDIGTVTDVLFDDKRWVVRYLVVRAGNWLTGRKVLISPFAVEQLDVERSELRLALTRERVKSSPDYDSDKPVSRQYEVDYFTHYGFPSYWAGPYLWGYMEYPLATSIPRSGPVPPHEPGFEQRAEQERARSDPHLRSLNEVSGYALEAQDGDAGQVETFMFQLKSWAIRGLVVDTKNGASAAS
jgi:PRC-barrel domain protein